MVNGERKPLGQDTNHVHAGIRRSSLENPRQNARVDQLGWRRLWGRVPRILWNAPEDGWKTSHKINGEECSPGSLRPIKKKTFLKMAAEIKTLLNLWPVPRREEPYDGRLSRTDLWEACGWNSRLPTRRVFFLAPLREICLTKWHCPKGALKPKSINLLIFLQKYKGATQEC